MGIAPAGARGWRLDRRSGWWLISRLMKTISICALLTLALSPLGLAELRIPRTVFQMDQLDEAKQKAAEDEEPLIFVITDPGTS
jgi:hypothetical protein